MQYFPRSFDLSQCWLLDCKRSEVGWINAPVAEHLRVPCAHTPCRELEPRLCGASLKPAPGTSLSSSPESPRGRSEPEGLSSRERTAPRPVRTQATLLASPENPPGASLVARSHLPLHLLNHIFKATVCTPSSPRSLSLSPEGFRAETFCPLERSGWCMEGGQVGAGPEDPEFSAWLYQATSGVLSPQLQSGERPGGKV